jgi:hypothetical protein
MSIIGYLEDFSLPEILQFIEKGRKTGLLKLRALNESPEMLPSVHYLWVYEGRLVAASHSLDHQGLVKLIEEHHWISNHLLTKLEQFYPKDEPLGLWFKAQGLLQTEQLKYLFNVQVLQKVCALFQLKDAIFEFKQDVSIPVREMTGWSVPAGVLNQAIVCLANMEPSIRIPNSEFGIRSSELRKNWQKSGIVG